VILQITGLSSRWIRFSMIPKTKVLLPTCPECGQKYEIIMSGRIAFVPAQWTDQGVCIRGDADPLPMFSSAVRMVQ